jgi:hypothetical protein
MQQIEFVSQVLPSLFHASPAQVLQFLERDGTKFLQFYWDQAGKKMSGESLSSTFGLNYEIRQPRVRETVALIHLPAPQVAGEAYVAALVYRPNRVTPFLRISDTTLVMALEHRLNERQQPVTLLVEYTRRLERLVLSPGPLPILEEFYQAVLQRMKVG